MSSLLEAKNLVKRFNGVKALNNCSIQIEEGKVSGLMGPNGAGKSTLLNAVMNRISLDSGKIFFQGEDITNIPTSEVHKKGIGRTYQEPRLFESMTVMENLYLSVQEKRFSPNLQSTFKRLDEPEVQTEELEEVLEVLEISHLRDELAANLSQGQKKLLAFGVAHVTGANLIFLDEPFGGVNPKLVDRMIKIIKEFNSRGNTFLVIEHEIPSLMKISDRIYVMGKGKIIADGKPNAIKNSEKVMETYFGK